MSFPSTAGNPRLGQSPAALTSLGAVGGPRGAGAGALRILVEFATVYDKEASERLQNDLRQLDHAANNSAIAEEKRQNKLLQVRGKLAESEALFRGKLDTAGRSELKRIESLASSRSKANKAEAAAALVQFNAAQKSAGFTDNELKILGQRTGLRKRELQLIAQQAAAEEGQHRRAKSRLAVEEQINKVQVGRASLGAKLGGLALGLVGGAIGAGLIGGAFALAGAGIDLLSQKVQDILDPARHAKEALVDVAKAVDKIAQSEGISILKAAGKYLEQIGLQADNATRALLAKSVLDQQTLDLLKQQNIAAEIFLHSKALEKQLRDEAREAIIKEAKALGTYQEIVNPKAPRRSVQILIDGLTLEAAVTNRVGQSMDYAAGAADRLSAAQQALALGAARASLGQELLANAIQRLTESQTAPLQAQIDALSIEPSARTKQLEAALERASGGGTSTQLRNIAEERALILLRQRLRLLGAAVDLEKYSGKFLLEAINAKINALQKEGQAQERLNQLLDLQFRMSQTIKRQQGESIADFLGRRAQENRHLLAEQANLERQQKIDSLELLRDKVQDEVALAENAEQRKNVIAAAGATARQKLLQKELEASKKHDKEVYEAQKKALEDQKAAIKEAGNESLRLLSESELEKTKITLIAAFNAQQLARVQGRIQGYTTAKAILEAMAEAFILPDFMVRPLLDKIDALLNTYRQKSNLFNQPPIPGVGIRPFAHGGVFQLNNASTQFGSNIRTGEQGTELGVVLSHRVAAILQKQKGGPNQIGPFNLYGSQDPLRDKYAFKRLVKEAVSEALA